MLHEIMCLSWPVTPQERRRPIPFGRCVEELEVRELLSAAPTIVGPVEVVRGQEVAYELRYEEEAVAGGFSLGERTIPLAGIDPSVRVRDVLSHGGVLHLVGSSGGMAARQLIELGPTPVIHAPEVLPSLESQANPAFGDPTGLIFDVEVVSGSVRYYGESRSPDNGPGLGEATAWDPATGAATGLGFASPGSTWSAALAGSRDGIQVGIDSSQAFVVSATGGGRRLPNTGDTQSGAADVSADGSIIVGGSGGVPVFWRADELATLDYTLGSLDAPPDGILAGVGRQVFVDPVIGEVGLFEYLHPGTFSLITGAWDLSDGSFIRSFGPGSILADAGIFGGELVVAINGPGGGYLTTLSDPETIFLADLLPPGHGFDRIDFMQGGLYEGSLGFLASGDNALGSMLFTASYHLNTTPAAVPEPSSVLLLALGMISAWVFRRRLGLVA